MGGLTSLNKGKRGEREVVRLVQPVVTEIYSGVGLEPPSIERNLMQSRKGGFDVVGLTWLALEVKYQEQENLNGWWLQCKDQAGAGQEPVLLHRRNGTKWKCRMFGYLDAGGPHKVRCPVDIGVEAFLLYLKLRLRKELTQSQGPAII